MKLRHAAAFALMGWFLMVPPCGQCPKGDSRVIMGDTCPCPDPSAPLNKWLKDGSFNSRDACEERRKAQTTRSADDYQCVYEDDPRLAK